MIGPLAMKTIPRHCSKGRSGLDSIDLDGPDSEAKKLVRELGALFADDADALAVIGGVAYNFWCEPRYTKDVDFNIAADAKVMAHIRGRLIRDGYVVTRSQGLDDPGGPDFVRFIQPGTPKMVEFIGAKTPFQELTIQRGVRLDADQPFPIATPEDVIVLKLIANRSADHRDLMGLGQVEGLDWEYIEYWSKIWEVSDALASLRVSLEQDKQRVKDLFA